MAHCPSSYDRHWTKILPTAILSSLMFYTSWPLLTEAFWMGERDWHTATGQDKSCMKTAPQEEAVAADQLLHSAVTARRPLRLHALTFILHTLHDNINCSLAQPYLALYLCTVVRKGSQEEYRWGVPASQLCLAWFQGWALGR